VFPVVICGAGPVGLVLDPDKESVCFKLTWRRLDGSVTAAHIHQAPRGSDDQRRWYYSPSNRVSSGRVWRPEVGR